MSQMFPTDNDVDDVPTTEQVDVTEHAHVRKTKSIA